MDKSSTLSFLITPPVRLELTTSAAHHASVVQTAAIRLPKRSTVSASLKKLTKKEEQHGLRPHCSSFLAASVRLELTTLRLTAACSTN